VSRIKRRRGVTSPATGQPDDLCAAGPATRCRTWRSLCHAPEERAVRPIRCAAGDDLAIAWSCRSKSQTPVAGPWLSAALARDSSTEPKRASIEPLHALSVARRSAVKAQQATWRQIGALLIKCPSRDARPVPRPARRETRCSTVKHAAPPDRRRAPGRLRVRAALDPDSPEGFSSCSGALWDSGTTRSKVLVDTRVNEVAVRGAASSN
jgi:hypothetical protein